MVKLANYLGLAASILWLSACAEKPLTPVAKLEVAKIGMTAAALSDDAQYAIIGSVHHGISLWRLDDDERLYDWNHQAKIFTTLIAADFSPDRQWAVTADAHTIVLWQTDTGEAPRYWRAPGEIESIALARDGSSALLGLSDHTAVLFDIKRGGILRTLQHNNRVRSVALSDDNRIAVTGSEDYSAIAWDLQTGKAISRLDHEDEVQLVALSGDGELAMSMAKYDRAAVWQTQTGNLVGELPLHAEHIKRGLRFTAARFNAEKTLLLTGTPDQRISLWRIPELTEVARWQVAKRSAWKPTGASILDVAFISDTQFRAVASNGFIVTLTLP